MRIWQDVFAVEYMNAKKNKKPISGWVIIDKRTNSRYAKCYPSEIVAQGLAKRKFERLVKEIEELFVSKDE